MMVLTSFIAALVGLGLYLLIQPGSIAPDALAAVAKDADAMAQISRTPETVYGHILNAIPNNLVRPFFEGNVLPISSSRPASASRSRFSARRART